MYLVTHSLLIRDLLHGKRIEGDNGFFPSSECIIESILLDIKIGIVSLKIVVSQRIAIRILIGVTHLILRFNLIIFEIKSTKRTRSVLILYGYKRNKEKHNLNLIRNNRMCKHILNA